MVDIQIENRFDKKEVIAATLKKLDALSIGQATWRMDKASDSIYDIVKRILSPGKTQVVKNEREHVSIQNTWSSMLNDVNEICSSYHEDPPSDRILYYAGQIDFIVETLSRRKHRSEKSMLVRLFD